VFRQFNFFGSCSFLTAQGLPINKADSKRNGFVEVAQFLNIF
jgi:hypothetical protein